LLLAAPDINVEIFRTVIAPKLAAMQQTRTTIYAASADLALKASKYVHGYKRVGDSAGGVFVYSGLHSVDASAAASSIRSYGHAYVMDSLALLKDVRMIIGERGEPLARGLLQMGQSPEQYWRLP
jgi:esterase/lipase superfamily enzyme